jgi:hypothetical protein
MRAGVNSVTGVLDDNNIRCAHHGPSPALALTQRTSLSVQRSVAVHTPTCCEQAAGDKSARQRFQQVIPSKALVCTRFPSDASCPETPVVSVFLRQRGLRSDVSEAHRVCFGFAAPHSPVWGSLESSGLFSHGTTRTPRVHEATLHPNRSTSQSSPRSSRYPVCFRL